MKATIDKNDWVRCGNCGHKLMRMVYAGKGEVIAETKCHSCKEQNIIHIMPTKTSNLPVQTD